MSNGKDGAGKTLITAGIAGGTAGLIIRLLTPKPVTAAEPGERWDDLIESQAAILLLLQQLLTAQEAVEVTVTTPWVAKEPEQILDQAIRSVGTFNTDKMVDCTNIKRTLLKVESSLDQAVVIQPVGNIVDSLLLTTNIGPPLPCIANGNISIGLAWDDWHPFIGIIITTGVAPTTGILKIWAVVQE